MSRRLRERHLNLQRDEVLLSAVPRAGAFRVALCYPNLYFVGMSNLGFQGVYRMFNDAPGVVCERVFLPDDVDAADLGRGGQHLTSFESGSDLRGFDVVAFSVSFENDYVHVLKMMRMAGIRGGGYVEDLMLRPSNERVDADIRYLKFMNLNALRMEAPRGSDYLFERCDEEGILIMVGWCCGLAFESWKNWKACEPLHIQYNYKENAVQLVNCYYQDFKVLKVTTRVFDFQMKEIFSKEITTGMKADESKILFKLDLPKELTNIYFVKLILQDKAGKEISSNFYWLSAKGDENADFTDLDILPKVDVTVKLSPLLKENGKLKLAVELTNTSTSLAFAVNPKLLSVSTREPVLPIFWQDNYFSLLPGDKRTIEMHLDASLVTEGKLLFKLDGWNLRALHEQELTVP